MLANRYLGIPLVGYFDDFAAIIRRVLGKAALDTLTRFCALLGFQMKSEKSQVGPAVVFLGLLGVPPARLTAGNYPFRCRVKTRGMFRSTPQLPQGGYGFPPLP